MGITVALMDGRRQHFEQFTDIHHVLNRHFPQEENSEFLHLSAVDLYGDTMFNYLQVPRLIRELREAIAKCGSDEERALLERIVRLAERVEHERLYLWFFGD